MRIGFSDWEIIDSVYQERARVDSAGVLLYFSRSSPHVQKGVLNRFEKEQHDALN